MKEQVREEEEDFNNPSAAIAKYQARADKA
jgi:hypothetical protein